MAQQASTMLSEIPVPEASEHEEKDWSRRSSFAENTPLTLVTRQ